MRRLDVWKRLLWKELREGRFVMLAAIAAPPLLFPRALAFGSGSWQRGLFAFPAAAGLHIAVGLWAAGKGNGKRQTAEYSAAHLPVHPLAEWVTSVVVPVLALAAAGMWFGYWASAPGDPDKRIMSLMGALDLPTTYLVCYLIATVISNWAAIIFGGFRVIGGTLISVWTLTPMLPPSGNGFSEANLFVISTATGAFVGTFLFAAMSQKRSIGFRQVVSLLAMVVIAFGPSVSMLDIGDLLPKNSHSTTISVGSMDTDGMIRVGYRCVGPDDYRYEVVSARYGFRPVTSWRNSPITSAQAKFWRNARERTRTFQEETQIIGTAGHSVYIAQQTSPNQGVKVLEWDALTNDVHQRAVIPAYGEALPGGNDFNDRASQPSPDGHYLLKYLNSMRGGGFDLWAVDLRTGKSRVALFCQSVAWGDSVFWFDHKAVIAQTDHAIEIDLRTMTTKPFRVVAGGVRR